MPRNAVEWSTVEWSVIESSVIESGFAEWSAVEWRMNLSASVSTAGYGTLAWSARAARLLRSPAQAMCASMGRGSIHQDVWSDPAT
jgi:hypothetical protein